MSIFGTFLLNYRARHQLRPQHPRRGLFFCSRQHTEAVPLSAPASASPPEQAVDVTAVLDALSVKRSEKLNEKLDWRNSTADLMKVLAVESNLQARQELAKKLQYEGDMKSSAATDCWLHGKIMAILAANGGKLPNELRRRWYLSHYGP